MDRIITNPSGVIEPAHLGQMFWDADSEVFYQARGRTADDWRLVTPGEMPGSFIKVYDFFLGPMMPALAAAKDDHGLAERFVDSEAVRATMQMDGVRVFHAFAWRAANGTDAMMARIKFDRVEGLSLFVGFAVSKSAHQMPHGDGFDIDDGVVSIGNRSRQIEPGQTLMFRVEQRPALKCVMTTMFINGENFATVGVLGGAVDPVVAVFVRGPGDRKVAPGYALALKHNLELAGPDGFKQGRAA